jgi:alpha-beta hydrolase superfamily lysophospholipase
MSERTYEVLDRPDVLSVLFYPRRDVSALRLAADVHSVRIPVEPDVEIGGRIFFAQPGDPVIVYFHGNGEIASDYDTIAPFYTRLGITLFVLDYRGYGTSDGQPTATAMIRDARSCFAQVRAVLTAKGLEAGDLYVMGRSLGSAAAIDVAARRPADLAGLIIESGFAYTFALVERLGFLQIPDAFEHRDGFGNLDKIASVDLPLLIIHGERDWMIPIGDAEALHDAAKSSNKRLLRVAGAGHNDLMLVGRKAYFEAIAAMCDRTIEQQPEPPAAGSL